MVTKLSSMVSLCFQACRNHPKTVKPFQDRHPVRTLHFLWLGLELHVLPFVAGGVKNPAIIQDPIGRRGVDASIDEHLQLQDTQRYFHAQGAKQTTSPCILHKKCTLTQISVIVISTAQKWIVDTGPAGLSAPSAAPHLGWWTQQCAKFLPVAVVILDQSRPLPTSRRWQQMNTWRQASPDRLRLPVVKCAGVSRMKRGLLDQTG